MKRVSTVDGLKRGIGTAAPVSHSDVTNAPPGGEDVTAAKAEKWPARISMTASREMKRELEEARIEDGIEVTARLRAMITLWQSDPQLRARVDELAKTLR
jgi:hypothetical protein